MLAKKLTALTALGALVLSGCAPGEQYQPKPSESPSPSSTTTQTAPKPSPLEPTSYRQVIIKPADPSAAKTEAQLYQTMVKLEDGTVVHCISQMYRARGTAISCDWENARRPSNPTETPTP